MSERPKDKAMEGEKPSNVVREAAPNLGYNEPDEDYSDDVFENDLKKAKPQLADLASKARKALKEGTAQVFPK